METNNSPRFQTRGVLAGAYLSAKTLLTHIADTTVDSDSSMCKRVAEGHLVDEYGMSPEELRARPTCPRCGKIWDKLKAEGKL